MGIRTRLLVVLSIFHFVEFPYILTIFLLNSREIFTKSRFDVTRKSVTSRTRAIIILPRSFILLDEDVLIHPRFQGLFPTSQGPGNEDGADRVMPLKKQGTPIVFLLNIYLFSRAMFCIYMLILRASFAMHKISCTMQHNDPRNEL